ncbi:MAG: STAS domain-containing protein [Planctomycetota bacterium]|jgi:anti-anti-sigma factor|nr:STAS domain-containing protein [Planctomycetota bacterium]
MAVALTIAENAPAGSAVLHIVGSLDAAAAKDFGDALMPLAENAGLGRVVLDCRELKFVASAGLRVLIGAVKAMRPRQAALCVAGMNDDCVAVLKMTGFLPLLKLAPTIEACFT